MYIIHVCTELSDQELSRALSRREFCDYLDNLIGHELSASFDKIMEFLFSAVKVIKLLQQTPISKFTVFIYISMHLLIKGKKLQTVHTDT